MILEKAQKKSAPVQNNKDFLPKCFQDGQPDDGLLCMMTSHANHLLLPNQDGSKAVRLCSFPLLYYRVACIIASINNLPLSFPFDREFHVGFEIVAVATEGPGEAVTKMMSGDYRQVKCRSVSQCCLYQLLSF